MKKDLHQDICDQKVFSAVYEKYARELHNYLYYKYGQNLDPNDKAQEAFIKLWENCKKIKFASARAFLYKAANNLMLNEIKHQKVVLRYQQQKPKSYTSENPEFLMEKDEYLKEYQAVLGRLTEEQRVAFLLNKVEGKKHEEIATMLGVTRKVIEYRIYSAFKALKEGLEGFKLK
ncbi:MAG: RNA polymerase sigma factor [Flavobacteriaceae bacterium]